MTGEKRMTLLGEKFPQMKVKTTHGEINLPDDYEGKWFVLFSHPGDFTPVCTTEFVAFSQKADKFKELNTELIGLSVDQVFSHIKWVEWIDEKLDVKVSFPIIADELGRVSNQLGMLHPNMGTNTVRAVFIVDDKGIVRLIMYYPQEVGRSIDEVLRSVKALQTADDNKIAAPENWPNNDLLGDKVIVPPADTEDAIKERLEQAEKGEIKCDDWWFCYREL